MCQCYFEGAIYTSIYVDTIMLITTILPVTAPNRTACINNKEYRLLSLFTKQTNTGFTLWPICCTPRTNCIGEFALFRYTYT